MRVRFPPALPMRLYFVTVAQLLGDGKMLVCGEGKLFIDAPSMADEFVFRIGETNMVIAFSAVKAEPPPAAEVLVKAEPVFSMEKAKALMLPPAPSKRPRVVSRSRRPRRRTRSPR